MLEPYVGFKIAIRSKWRRSSVKYVLKMKMKWALKVNFKTSTKWSASSRWANSKRSYAWSLPWRNEVQVQDEPTRRDHMLEACHEEMKCKFKMSHLEEIICLNLAIHMVIMDMWRCAEEEALPWWIMGEQSTRLRQASTIKKGVPSCCGQDRHHRAQVECASIRFALDRVSFSPVS